MGNWRGSAFEARNTVRRHFRTPCAGTWITGPNVPFSLPVVYSTFQSWATSSGMTNVSGQLVNRARIRHVATDSRRNVAEQCRIYDSRWTYLESAATHPDIGVFGPPRAREFPAPPGVLV